MPGCDIVERIIVDPATANDADRIVEGLHAKPGQRIFEQDPDGRACAGKREDHTAPRRLRTALDSTGKLFDVMAQTRSVGRQGGLVELQIALIDRQSTRLNSSH